MPPYPVFFSYSHKDEAFRDELERHLSGLVNTGKLVLWHDRKLVGGDEWQPAINQRLEDARIVLLLVSADFMHSPYCQDETKRAVAVTAMARRASSRSCSGPPISRVRPSRRSRASRRT